MINGFTVVLRVINGKLRSNSLNNRQTTSRVIIMRININILLSRLRGYASVKNIHI